MQQLDLSTQPWIDLSAVTDVIEPFLATHPRDCVVRLGLIDGVHSRVQRMLASLMDRFPDAQWDLHVHNTDSLEPPLYRRALKAISSFPGLT